ncbi:MAG: class D sortase [Anaerolineaceae bacterium]|nr:MAG: class D sortase [Anaerolineaceae bacterium]
MRDKRPVDELSLEELERLLAVRRRQARQSQINRMKKEGRIVAPPPMHPPSSRAEDVTLPPELADSVEPVDKHLRKAAPAMPQKVTRPMHKAMPTFDDDVDDVVAPVVRRHTAGGGGGGRVLNGFLLLAEVAAVIGLVLIGANLLSARDDLVETTRREQEIAQATRSAALPTVAPTAILRVDVNDWVLPGGHTFINDQPVQNLQELVSADIPSHLLPEVQMNLIAPVVARPPRTAETALALSIPKLNLDETIIQGSDWEALRLGVGQVLNGASPGDVSGNVALSAHNDIYGELFRHLDQLEPGDEFSIRTEERVYNYVVTRLEIVDPTDVWVLENTGLPTATLISCYPYRVNDKRIIVFADRVG